MGYFKKAIKTAYLISFKYVTKVYFCQIMKKLFCCPALELFCCLPLWKTVLFVSSRAFSLSTPTFLLSTPVENSEATWKKCNKNVLRGKKK